MPSTSLPFRLPRSARALATLLVPAALAAGLVQEPWPLRDPAPAVDLRPARLERLDGLTCGECHAAIVDEWSHTGHAIAWVDEVYQEALSERKSPGLCASCHIPEPILAEGDIRRPRAREADPHLGIDCAACHLGPDGTWLGPRGAATDAHPTAASPHLTAPGSSALCARCHSTNIGPVIGIAKDFQEGGLEAKGFSCVGCHMAPLPAEGDAPARRSHLIQTPRDPAFLRLAFEPELRRDGGALRVVVHNRAGHRVPGLIGRMLRFRAEALDAAGAVVATAETTLDVDKHVPLGASFELALDGGVRIRLVGDQSDPREPERWVRFLEEELE